MHSILTMLAASLDGTEKQRARLVSMDRGQTGAAAVLGQARDNDFLTTGPVGLLNHMC